MPDDFYTGDEASESKTSEGMEGGNEGSDSGMGEEMGETTLIPRSLFGGHDPKPNEEYYFKVVATHGDEIEIAYSKGEEKETPDMDKESDDSPDGAFNERFSMMK